MIIATGNPKEPKVSVGESKYQWVTHVRSNQNTALAPKGNMSNKEIIIY